MRSFIDNEKNKKWKQNFVRKNIKMLFKYKYIIIKRERDVNDIICKLIKNGKYLLCKISHAVFIMWLIVFFFV